MLLLDGRVVGRRETRHWYRGSSGRASQPILRFRLFDALGASGELAGRLNGWKQERDQDGDDRDDNQQLDQRRNLVASLG